MKKKDENYVRGIRLKEAMKQNDVTMEILKPIDKLKLSEKRKYDIIQGNFKSLNDSTIVLVCEQIGIDPYEIFFGGDHFNPCCILEALEKKGYTPKAIKMETEIEETAIEEILQGKFPRGNELEKMVKTIEDYRKELSDLLDIPEDDVFPTQNRYIFSSLKREANFNENQAIIRLIEICESFNSNEKLRQLIKYAEDLQFQDKEKYNNPRDRFEFQDLYL